MSWLLAMIFIDLVVVYMAPEKLDGPTDKTGIHTQKFIHVHACYSLSLYIHVYTQMWMYRLLTPSLFVLAGITAQF